MADYIIHKAVTLDKVRAKRRALLEQPRYLEDNYIAQAKYDGCNLVALYDGKTVEFLSRTGETVFSCDHIRMCLMTFPGIKPGVYLGEAWCPDATFPEISGWFRRHGTDEDTARLQFVIFDYLTPEEWIAESSDVGYANRVSRIVPEFFSIKQGTAPIWSAGSFGHISETWSNVATAQQVCNELVAAGGYDGLILRDPNGTWKRNDRGTNGEIIKVKQVLSFDLRVVGYEPGKGKHAGKIGTLLVSYNGVRQGAGTGLKDSERDVANYHRDWHEAIVEIECLGVTADGKLREPRMKGIRFDKTEPDA